MSTSYEGMKPGSTPAPSSQGVKHEELAVSTPRAFVQKGSVHFSSATDLWETPLDFFERLDAEFRFETDVCAISANAKCSRFFSPEIDGLQQEWTGTCWMNPPYGREIGRWMRKAYESAMQGATVVCLVPARTDTAWWHDYAKKGDIRFIRGRLKFGGHQNSAPFPSAVVIFRPEALALEKSA